MTDTFPVSAIDRLIHANESYTERFPGPRPLRPKLRLAVVACMDSRLDLFGALGLDIGDAHLIRNAGGMVTHDVLRSLALSQRSLGTREIVVLHHTECGMTDFDDAAFRAQLTADSGEEPDWDVPGFSDVRAQVRESLQVLRTCAWLPHRDDVRGFVFDVASARLEEVAGELS
jgi:carbonic anhydrase